MTIAKFKDAECCKRFRSEIHKRSKDQNINRTNSINTMWKKIYDTIKEASTEVLDKPRNTKKPWFNERCKRALSH